MSIFLLFAFQNCTSSFQALQYDFVDFASKTNEFTEPKRTAGDSNEPHRLHSLAEIKLARMNAKVFDVTVLNDLTAPQSLVDRWMQVATEDVWWHITDSSVPRAFNISPTETVYYDFDFSNPFMVGKNGTWFPNNHDDILSYYKSHKTLVGYVCSNNCSGVVDNGYGYLAHAGDRNKNWYVAYGNHQYWRGIVAPGLLNLSRVYLLTGEKKYATKAIEILERIAEVYPDMDYDQQSREGSLQERISLYMNKCYNGKVVNRVWEVEDLLPKITEAYDNVQDQLTDEQKKNIQARIFKVATDGILNTDICHRLYGNYGMHQRTLAMITKVTDSDSHILDGILFQTGPNAIYEGYSYSLYNNIHRDGMGMESPGYNEHWIDSLAEATEFIDSKYFDIKNNPQVRRLFDSFNDIVINNKITPALGDTTSYKHAIITNADAYRIAFWQRPDSKQMAEMYSFASNATRSFVTYDSLFHESITEKIQSLISTLSFKSSRVLDGYGLAILNTRNENIALSLFYGPHTSHHHLDGLHFDLYAYGRPLMPDFGYPDAMNNSVLSVFAWTSNTVAHNTVVVDATAQRKQQTIGQLYSFASGNKVQYVDAESADRYLQSIRPYLGYSNETTENPAKIATIYRRSMLLVSTGDNDAYVVDIFRASGGHQHDYILHQGIINPSLSNGTWTAQNAENFRTIITGAFSAAQTTGTLAGVDVPLQTNTIAPYDRPTLPETNYGFARYDGSGFQYIVKPRFQSDAPNGVVIDFKLPTESSQGVVLLPEVKLRTHLLGSENQQAILAEALVSPDHYRLYTVPFLIARRTSSANTLNSTFVSLLEPYTRTNYKVSQIERLNLNSEADVVLKVKFVSNSYDVIAQRANVENKAAFHFSIAGEAYVTDAAAIVLHFDATGRQMGADVISGTYLNKGAVNKPFEGTFSGLISALDLVNNTVDITWAGCVGDCLARLNTAIIRKVLFFNNGNSVGRKENAFTVLSSVQINNETLRLQLKESIINGKGRIYSIKNLNSYSELVSDTVFSIKETYNGMYLCKKINRVDGQEDCENLVQINDVKVSAIDGDRNYLTCKTALNLSDKLAATEGDTFLISVLNKNNSVRLDLISEIAF